MQQAPFSLKSSSPAVFGRGALVALIGCLAIGCTGEIGGDSGPAPPPDVAPRDVTQNLELLAADGYCVELGVGEELRAVSPEGHAWLVTAKAGMTAVRVLDAFDSAVEITRDVELTNINRLQAWSATDAAVITDDGLWRLEDLGRVQLAPPQGFSSSAGLCGDPGTNGSLLCSGKLYERRDDDQWWSWSPGASGDAAPSALLGQQGECQGADDSGWMTSPDGTLWRMQPSSVHRPVQFEALEEAAVTSGVGVDAPAVVAVVDGERLWTGPDSWQVWTFPNGAPAQLSAAGGKVWITSGTRLLRFDGSKWAAVALASAPSGSIDSVHAHAGGAWVSRGGSVCHVATESMLRVSGVRPFSRSKEIEYSVALSASDASAVSASLDGKALVLTADVTTGVFSGSIRLDKVGWHELLVEAGSAKRSVLVKRLPEYARSWATDIQPIHEKHCSGGDCHTSGNPKGGPALSSYEDWVRYAKQIRTRVVDAGNMPPAANKSADYDSGDVQVIAQWLAGGMAP
jgi:hypothetical protein